MSDKTTTTTSSTKEEDLVMKNALLRWKEKKIPLPVLVEECNKFKGHREGQIFKRDEDPLDQTIPSKVGYWLDNRYENLPDGQHNKLNGILQQLKCNDKLDLN